MPYLNTLPMNPLPDLPLRRSPEYRLNEVQYGDGYKLVAEDGVNATTNRVSLTWSTLTEEEQDAIVSFLEAHAPATPFYYTAPGLPQRPYRCTSMTHEQINVGLWTVTAELEEYHGATV